MAAVVSLRSSAPRDLRAEPRIDFFVIGAQKAGTTALDAMLRTHPSVQMAAVKETHFFDDEAVNWTTPDYAALHSVYNWTSDDTRVRGEATPITLYWPGALDRLRCYNPGARLIVGLRHPAFRAFSHWCMETVRGRENLCFEEAVAPAARERVSRAPGGVHRVFSYVERGLYSPQIRRLLELFPREQILFYRTDWLWADLEATMRRIHGFIGTDEAPVCGPSYIVPIDSSAVGEMPGVVRARLDDFFHRDIHATAKLAALELSDWLDPAYEEPMRRPGGFVSPKRTGL